MLIVGAYMHHAKLVHAVRACMHVRACVRTQQLSEATAAVPSMEQCGEHSTCDRLNWVRRGTVHTLDKAAKKSGERKGDVTAVVAPVMEDVEEYLVSNLVELERAGANGNNPVPEFKMLLDCTSGRYTFAAD